MAGGTRDQSGRSPRQSFHQAWEVPADFEIGRLRIVMGSTTITFKIEPPPPPPHVRETARIAIRVKSGGTALTVCLARADGERLCPDLAEIGVSGQGTNWVQSATLRWSVDLSTDTLDDIAQPGPSCAVEPTLGELAWQVTALGENGSAVYVGRNQFLTSDRLFTDSTPWAVIARGDVAFPAVRVARDQRDGLALVEVIGETSLTDVPDPVRFSETSADAESCGLVLIGYPWGDADRFAMTRLQVHEVTERLIKHDGWGWERAGAPLIDPCTWEVLGISTGNNEAIRAETVGRTLEQLRGRRVMPELADQGPTLLGSVALLPQPVYLGTEQPDFGGWICNVRPSARYDVLYAVYLVSHASPEIVSVRDGERIYPATCGWRDRIFILEYRSDERPSAVCAEPSAPSSPLSSLSLDLAAPAGIELLQVTEFKREDCAGLDETTRWSSTHFVRLRNTGAYELEDLVVQLENEFGERFTPRLANYDPDPDVRGWRFDLGDSEPSRLLVWASRDRRLFEGDPECVEKHDRRGDAIVSAVLYESSAEFGTFRLLTYAAPWRCPWAYTHGVEITLADPLPEKRWFSVSLFGADGTVISGDWFSKFTTTTHYDDSSTTKLVQPWEVPEDFTPIELGVQIGDRFWAVPLPALE